MAKSGLTNVKITSWNVLRFSWSESSQSVVNNTTTISWKLELIATSDGRIDSSVSKDWSVTINGKKYSGTNTIGISNNSTKTLASGTTTIAHNSDGTKTFSYSFIQEFAITFGGENLGTRAGSGSGTLDTIARTSTLSVSGGTLGTAAKLTVTRQSTSFKHSIYAMRGNTLLGYIRSDGGITNQVIQHNATDISFVPPLTWAEHSPNQGTVSVTFTIKTYNGDTLVGSSTATATYNIPESVKPSVSSVAVSDPTGHSGTFGAYVQGQSKLKIVATGSGNRGSTIKSYKIEADGKTYTGATVTTDAIKGSGTLTIKVTVTDSRNRTATASTTVSVLAYSFPKITALAVDRRDYDADGNNYVKGGYLAVKFSSDITSLNSKNTAAYTIQHKKAKETSYTTETLTAFAGQQSVSDGVFVFPAEASSSYDIILTVKDAFKSVNKTASGSSVKKVWSLLKKAGEISGYAIGKVAELEGVLDIALPVKLREGIIQNVLWSGGYYMTSGHTVPLSEPVSKQPSGIVLVFSEYIDGATSDTAFHTRFIPKTLVATHPGKGHCIQLSSSNLDHFGTKYLYISDDKIVGHDNNNMTGTGDCGITFNNARFVLRYVIGV